MKWSILTLVGLIPSIICATAGAWLCYQGRDGWGWFLFVAVLLFSLPYWKQDGGGGFDED